MFETLSTTSVKRQKKLSGTYQSFGSHIFKASSQEQEYSYGPFQRVYPLNSTISVYKEDNLYSSYPVNNQDKQHRNYSFMLSMEPDIDRLNQQQEELILRQEEELKLRQQKVLKLRPQEEELEQALKSLTNFLLPYIDQVVKPDLTVTDCEDILHLMSWSDMEHFKLSFYALLKNKLHDNVYEAARKIFSNEIVCNCIYYKLIEIFPSDGKTILYDHEMLPFDCEEDCSLLLKLIYMCKPTRNNVRLLRILFRSIVSVAKYFPKLVNVMFCELLSDVVCDRYWYLSTEQFTEAVSAISDDNFYMCLFEGCLKFINDKYDKIKSVFEDDTYLSCDDEIDDPDYYLYNKAIKLISLLFVCWKQLQTKKQQENGKQLIIKYKDVILFIVEYIENETTSCDERQQYCMMLLHLIDHYNSIGNVMKTGTIFASLTGLMTSHDTSCEERQQYCRMLLNLLHHYNSIGNVMKTGTKLILTALTNLMTSWMTSCEEKQQYCILLLRLFHHYNSTKDFKETGTILTALTNFKVKLWEDTSDHERIYECYCNGGTRVCSPYYKHDESKSNSDTKYIDVELIQCQIEILEQTFKYHMICLCDWHFDRGYMDCVRFKVIEDVSSGNIKFVHYLESLSKSLFDKTNKRYADISYKNKTCTDTVVYQFSYIMEKIIDHNKEEELLNVIKTLCQHDISTELRDLLAQGLIAAFKVKYFNQTVQISKLILDMNMKIQKCEFLDYLTLQIGKLFGIDGNKEEVLYKCFCILRHENRNNRTETNTTEIYREHFTFISRLEKEEEMEKLLRHMELVLLIMLLLVSVSYGGHYSSAELKKYLSLKYEYDNAILYLLWCSGDVEINPGPTLKEIKKVPPSIKERNWIYDACSNMLKLLKGIPACSNPNKNLWDEKDKPDTWPKNEPFYDPRNPKGYKRNTESDKQLLHNLQQCCKKENVDIPLELHKELTASENDDKILLFQMYIARQELGGISDAMQYLTQYKDTPELLNFLNSLKAVKISFDSNILSGNNGDNKKSKSETEVIRDLKVTLGRISKGVNPLIKSDGLWKEPPEGWKQENLQLYRNATKRTGKEQDKKLVDTLLQYCDETGKAIPTDCFPMINAWKLGDMETVHKCHTIWSNFTIIEHSLKYLQVEDLLCTPYVQEKLKKLKITFDLESLKIDTCKSAGVTNKQNCISTSQGSKWLDNQPGPSTASHVPVSLKNSHQKGGQTSLESRCTTNDDEKKSNQKLPVTKTKGKRKRKLDSNEKGCRKKTRQHLSDKQSSSLSLPDDQPVSPVSSAKDVPLKHVPIESIVSDEDIPLKQKSGKNEPGCTAQKRQFVCHDDESLGGLVSTNEQVPVDSIVLSQEDVQMVLELPCNISIGSNTAGSSDVTQSYMTINDDGTTNTTVTVSQTVSTSSHSSEQSSSLEKVMSKHCTDSDSNGQKIGSPTLDDKFKQILRELNL